jgi:hypothetical protein
MKKTKVTCILFILMGSTLLCQDLVKNYLGLSVGIVPKTMDMYFDMPLNTWPNRELSPIFNVFYSRQVRESFRVGTYLEYEKVNYSNVNSSLINSLKRYSLGLSWLGHFPKTALQFQLGGYFGYGILSGPGWDNQTGSDLGIIAGPAYELKKFGIAVHLQGGHGWYESSGNPLGVMLYDPKILLKVYYKLSDF